jgi:integrase
MYYRASNTRSNEYDNCRYAVRPLVAVCGAVRVSSFVADDLRRARDVMVSGRWYSPAARKPVRPWPRAHVNAQVNRIKRMFRWGVESGLVPADVAAVVCAVSPLRAGRSLAVESGPVVAVAARVVEATLPHLPAVVRAMVELQRLTGMRSDNVCSLRPCDLDRSGDAWLYRPAAHKGSRAGRPLIVPLGPRGQAVLEPFLDRPADLPCFSPAEVAGRSVGRRAPGSRYTTGSYRRAIERACELAFAMPAELRHVRPVRRRRGEGDAELAARSADRERRLVAAAEWRRAHCWHPHQLRHAAADRAKRVLGLDGARAYLGHSEVSTTEIYEARDLAMAREIARAIG